MWSEKWNRIFEALNDKIIPCSQLTKHTDITYRMVNDWDLRGMFDAERQTMRGWRKFSIVDVIKLSIIKKLKGAGFPLYKLKDILNWLGCNPAIEFSIKQLTENINCSLYTDFEDEYGIYSDEELLNFLKVRKEKELLSIIFPVNHLIKNILISIKSTSLEVKIVSEQYMFKVNGKWITP
ncbi:MerR family transcriptional regulator [Candidatus Desantisbacteria bacterium]|nr:MerR family transcriptional regulator [Candidatus Desantisbacteria bacterium]